MLISASATCRGFVSDCILEWVAGYCKRGPLTKVLDCSMYVRTRLQWCSEHDSQVTEKSVRPLILSCGSTRPQLFGPYSDQRYFASKIVKTLIIYKIYTQSEYSKCLVVEVLAVVIFHPFQGGADFSVTREHDNQGLELPALAGVLGMQVPYRYVSGALRDWARRQFRGPEY